MIVLALEVKFMINVRKFENEFKVQASIYRFNLDPGVLWAIHCNGVPRDIQHHGLTRLVIQDLRYCYHAFLHDPPPSSVPLSKKSSAFGLLLGKCRATSGMTKYDHIQLSNITTYF